MEFIMKPFVCSFSLLIMLRIAQNKGDRQLQQCEASTVGTKFIVGVIGYTSQLDHATIQLFITPTTEHRPAHVRVFAPFVNFDRSYTVSNHTNIYFYDTVFQYEAGKQFRGIEVSSDVNISLTVFSGGYLDVTEGFLALPVTALGTHYIAASYRPYSSYSSEILIAGVDNNTDVILKTMLNGHTNSSLTFRLQKFETYQFKSNNDVSGSVITSTKPVAVFSGSAAAKIPVGIGDIQFIVEQMIPTKYWTTKFIIPPIYPRKHFVLKIFTDHDNTEVHYYNATKHYNAYMGKGSQEELLFGTDPIVVLANKPISVIQYGHDGDDMAGDPFMANAQGISHFQDSYQFFTQNYFDSVGSNTIAITVRKIDISDLRLNGHPMSYWNASNVPVAHPMEEYVAVFVNISYSSYFRLHHTRGMKFGAVLYGRPGNAVAYGYPLQLHLFEPDCGSHTASSATTDAFAQTTVATTYASQTSNGQRAWCFQCDGMAHLKYCDKVSRCQNKNEVCFVQRYSRTIGVDRYRSGCIQPEQCNRGSGNGGCFECCNGHFCNNVGCGDTGFSDLLHRGPLCFDCPYKGGNEDCNIAQLCNSDQVCMIKKYEWGDNDFHYVRECADTRVCTTKRSIAARNAPVCSHCCHSDFCNINCTSGNTGPASIVG